MKELSPNEIIEMYSNGATLRKVNLVIFQKIYPGRLLLLEYLMLLVKVLIGTKRPVEFKVKYSS